MFAIIKTGGKQYTVKAGQILKVEKLEGKKGDNISLKNVLALSYSSNHKIGNPIIKGASVEAKIIDHIRDKKIIVFKKRKRQNYRSTRGHRQYLTLLKIESIQDNGKKISSQIKEEKNIIDKDKNLKRKNVKKIAKKIIKKKISTKKISDTKKTTVNNIKKKVVNRKNIKEK